MDPESTDGEAAAAVPLPQALRAKISEMIYVSKGPGAEQRKLEAQLRACETYAQLRRFLKKQLKHMSTLGLMAVQVALCTLHVTRIPCLGSSVRPDATLRAHTRSSCWMRDGRPGSAGPRWPWSVRWRPAPSAGPRSAGRRPGRSLPGNPPAARNPPWLPGRGGQPRPSQRPTAAAPGLRSVATGLAQDPNPRPAAPLQLAAAGDARGHQACDGAVSARSPREGKLAHAAPLSARRGTPRGGQQQQRAVRCMLPPELLRQHGDWARAAAVHV